MHPEQGNLESYIWNFAIQFHNASNYMRSFTSRVSEAVCQLQNSGPGRRLELQSKVQYIIYVSLLFFFGKMGY